MPMQAGRFQHAYAPLRVERVAGLQFEDVAFRVLHQGAEIFALADDADQLPVGGFAQVSPAAVRASFVLLCAGFLPGQ